MSSLYDFCNVHMWFVVVLPRCFVFPFPSLPHAALLLHHQRDYNLILSILSNVSDRLGFPSLISNGGCTSGSLNSPHKL